MASGVKIDDECKMAYQDVKIGSKYRYLVFAISEDFKSIIVANKASPEKTYEDFVAEMLEAEKAKECRYALFDVEYTTKEGQRRNKICFFMWSPETATIKQRMLYAASKDALKKALGDGIAKEVQANDHSDLQKSNVMEIISRTERT